MIKQITPHNSKLGVNFSPVDKIFVPTSSQGKHQINTSTYASARDWFLRTPLAAAYPEFTQNWRDVTFDVPLSQAR